MRTDCLMCNGELALLGKLGTLTWYTCVDCGAQQSFINTGRGDASQEE